MKQQLKPLFTFSFIHISMLSWCIFTFIFWIYLKYIQVICIYVVVIWQLKKDFRIVFFPTKPKYLSNRQNTVVIS